MTGPDVTKNSIRARAHLPPSGSGLNALNVALEEAVLSSASAAAVNGTSTSVLDSATSSFTPSASASQNVSASASASDLSAVQSSAAESSAVSESPASSEAVSPTSVAPPSKDSASDATLSDPNNVAEASSTPSDALPTSSAADSESPSPAPPASPPAATTGSSASFKTNPASDAPVVQSSAAVSSAVSESPASPESVSPTSAAPPSKESASDAAVSAPKNVAEPSSTPSDSSPTSSAAESEAPAPAPPAPSPPAATTEKSSATFKTNPAPPTPSDPPASTTTPAPSAAPEPTSPTAPETSSTTEAPAPPQTTSVSTQRDSQSTATGASPPSSANNQVPAPDTSDGGNSNPTSEAASPQPSGSFNTPANQGNSGNFLSNAGQRNSPPSATGVSRSGNANNLGNGFIGVGPSSNIRVDSTLATPEAVTMTSGDSTFATTPPFITSIFTSNGPDGSPQTFTSVFANPTTAPQASNLGDSSFWDNKGAVAGVFVSLALTIISTILGIVYCCRRKRRRGMVRLTDDTQDRQFSDLPDMSQRPTTYQPMRGQGFMSDDPNRYLKGRSSSNGNDDPTTMQRSLSQASRNSSGDAHVGALGLTGVLARPPGLSGEYHGPFSDYHRYISTGDTRLVTPPSNSPVGIAVTTDFEKPTEPLREAEPKVERRSPSPAPSSPSIYPPSLPAVPEKDETDYLFYERETKRRPDSQLPTPPPRAVVNDSEPQNPFSSPLDPIYDGSLKQQSVPSASRINTNVSYRPLTPPDSSAGHSPTTPQLSGSEESTQTRPLNVATNPFSGAFLGRSVSLRTEPLPRPARNPLRLSAYGSSGSSLQSKEGSP